MKPKILPEGTKILFWDFYGCDDGESVGALLLANGLHIDVHKCRDYEYHITVYGDTWEDRRETIIGHFEQDLINYTEYLAARYNGV